MRRLALSAVVLFTISSCTAEDEDSADEGATDGNQAGTLQITTIASMPQITDPVAAYDATTSGEEVTAAADFNELVLSNALTATTGVSLGTKASDLKSRFDANQNASSAFCRTMNQSLRFMGGLVEADLVGCYMQKGFGEREAFYDGEYHIYDLVVSEVEDGEREEFKIRTKAKIAKDAAGNLNLFEAFLCEEDENSGKFDFIQYVKKTISEQKIAIISKNRSIFDNQGSEQTIMIASELQAALNTKGKMVGLKKIEHSETSDDGLKVEHAEVTQSDQNIQYIGWSGSGERLRRFFSFVELIDLNSSDKPYALTQLAYGDGAALFDINGQIEAQGWNGDTLDVDTNASRLVKVEGQEETLPKDTSPKLISFAEAESWDCSGSPEITIELNNADSDDCNERFLIDQNTSTLCSRWGY